MVLVHGANGQGKSNLLEALYMLAIAKSSRASTDRELVRWHAASERSHAQVSATAQRTNGNVRVQLDFTPVADAFVPGPELGDGKEEPGTTPVQKLVRINGVPRRASDLVGEINAVLFTAQDLELVLGSPSVRRRYLDILVSQLDRQYMRELQHYQRVLTQRNHLLKSIRETRSQTSELDYWDDEMVTAGAHVMSKRARAISDLNELAAPVLQELSGGTETLRLVYLPSVEIDAGTSDEDAQQAIRHGLESQRGREVAQGFTALGPHRDDLQMLLDDIDVALYASRGQCRTVVLAMKLAEASYLMDRAGQEPVLLLDDVLSELDADRRDRVLDRASKYEQCFITAADTEPVGDRYLRRMARLLVREGRAELETPSTTVNC